MMIGIANGNNLLLAYRLVTFFFIALLALYDFRHHKVKNQALIWFLPWCLLSLPIYAVSVPSLSVLLLLKAFLGFLSGGLLLLSVSYMTHGGIGGGDIKLAALLGIIYGASGICLLLSIASSTALLFCLLHTVFSGRKQEHIPFVPFLCAGLFFMFFR